MAFYEKESLAFFIALLLCANIAAGFEGSSYMCVDWSVGSERMYLAQFKHRQAGGEDAIFGVGSYSSIDQENIGKCFRFFVEGQSRPFIAQVTNNGGDIGSGQFDIQTGGGGFGIFNACAGATNRVVESDAASGDVCTSSNFDDISIFPLFPGSVTQWGERCGGQIFRSGCQFLPEWPTTLTNIPPKPTESLNSEPNLPTLCERAYDIGARKDNGNPAILQGSRVPCPEALVEVTGLQRSDEDQQQTMPQGVLTSTMDCCAPAGTNPNAFDAPTVPGRGAVIPCMRDGYTRVQ